jgi:hypothetical protein
MTRDDKIRWAIITGQMVLLGVVMVAAILFEALAPGTHDAIAAKYGVARATVSLIKERRTWRHLP